MNQIVIADNQRVKFSKYLTEHPHLYDGVELTQGEIDFINNEFWDYEVLPADFQVHFIQKIRMYIAQYKNMKQIEFCDRIFNITTNKAVRVIAQDTSNTLNSTASGSSSSSQTGSGSTYNDSNNKEAGRQLPMKSTGSDFEETVNWEEGASGISENKNVSHGQNSSSLSISGSDSRLLSNLGSGHLGSQDDYEAVNEAAVDIITRIWNYLLQPKALEWFTNKLQPCFILCW